MAYDLTDLPDPVVQFLEQRHLATLSTIRPGGGPHVVPVGFTYDVDERLARVITSATSVKVRNVAATGRAVLCQVDGGRWLSLEGAATVHDDATSVAEAEERYAARYQTPRINPSRVALHIAVDRLIGRVRA